MSVLEDLNKLSSQYVDPSISRMNLQLANFLRGSQSLIGKVFSGLNLSIEDLETRAASLESITGDNTALIETQFETFTNGLTAQASKSSTLEAKLNSISSVFDGFSIVGAIGDVTIAANETVASDINISEGYFDHPSLGEIEVQSTYFPTAWGVLFAPSNGWFLVVWSEEETSSRFDNNAGSGHFFPATEQDGVWYAYKNDRRRGEVFEPRDTDVVIAQCFKAENPDKPELSIVDGITEVKNFVRDTQVALARVETVEQAVVEEGQARASAIQDVQTSVGQAQSNASSALSAASDAESAVANLQQSVNTALEQANANANSALQSVADLDGAWAQFLIDLQANYDSSEATAEETAQAFAGLQTAFADFKTEVEVSVGSINGSVNSVLSAYADLNNTLELAAGFQLDNNGRISSIILLDDGSTSQAAFLADAFRIYNGSTEQAVFTASNGVVKMPNVEIDKLKVGSVTYTSLASDAVRNGAKKISNSSMDMLPNKQWKTIWSLTHNKREQDTEMYFTYKMRFDRPGNLSDVYFYRVQMELLRNGVVVDDDFKRIANTHPDGLNGRIVIEDLPTGSANWEVRVQVWEGSNNNGIPASTPVKLLKHRLELKEQK